MSGSVRHDGSLRFANNTDEPHLLAMSKLAPGATAKGCVFHNKGCGPGYGSGTISQGHSEVIAVSALHTGFERCPAVGYGTYACRVGPATSICPAANTGWAKIGPSG